jgi:uncharacterized protein (TIGR03435 family)
MRKHIRIPMTLHLTRHAVDFRSSTIQHSSFFRLLILLQLCIAPCILSAQEANPAFDVISVRRDPGPPFEFISTRDSSRGLHSIDTLKGLLAYAYGVRSEFVICKLPWCESSYFDITANVPTEDIQRFKKLSYAEKGKLLQDVLRSRFGVVVREQTQSEKVLNLIEIGKSKLKVSPSDHNTRPSDGALSVSPNRIQGEAVSLDTFTNALSNVFADQLDRPVNNATDLKGVYDIDLKWNSPTSAADSNENSNTDQNLTPAATSLSTALREQLGLKLRATVATERVVVLVSAHEPTPN